jgi:hypothetical protein
VAKLKYLGITPNNSKLYSRRRLNQIQFWECLLPFSPEIVYLFIYKRTIRVTKSKRMRWEVHVARIGGLGVNGSIILKRIIKR